jgi:hypothetical protein
MNPPADGADRMRRAAQVIAAIDQKLQAHELELGKASVIHVTCRFDKNGKLEVQIQTTF